jgi:hypothetical protein
MIFDWDNAAGVMLLLFLRKEEGVGGKANAKKGKYKKKK